MNALHKPRSGDLFTIPTGDGRVGYGQVVGTSGRFRYFAVFDFVVPEDQATEKAQASLQSPLLFLGLSMPSKLKAGDWKVVDHAEVPGQISLPAYKESVGSVTAFQVVDHTGTKRRPATDLEAELLPFRKVVSPMYFELALQAHLGLVEWRPEFEAIRPKGGATTHDFFGDR